MSNKLFTRAIVRPPASNFADGLTSVDLGIPDYKLALEQHGKYCDALERCRLSLTMLEPDGRYPDSTFVEDTALITPRGAIMTRPGAASRQGETDEMRIALERFYSSLKFIGEPGTVDAGDVCEAGDRFFVGISERTNAEGARQLAQHLGDLDYLSTVINIRGISNILHLKSGIAFLSPDTFVLIPDLANHEAFTGYRRVVVQHDEEYAANCLEINSYVLIASGYDNFRGQLEILGYQTIVLDMSEFRKMDGGLSCLSLRF